MRRLLARRPSETVAGVGLFGTVYGLLTQAGVGEALAAIVAVVIAFVPGAVSAAVDAKESATRADSSGH